MTDGFLFELSRLARSGLAPLKPQHIKESTALGGFRGILPLMILLLSAGVYCIIDRIADMEVALLSCTPEPELIVAAAARLSFSIVGAGELRQRLRSEQVNSLLERLLSSGHLSPFEHASFTFALDGISRVASHQLVRHRLASYTQQSQRFVSFKELNFVTPATIAAKGNLKAKYVELIEAGHELYRQMLDDGVPAEDARYVLPNAVETKLVMTMNARELMHACSLRLCQKAQWEIVELFERIKAEVAKVAPRIGAELNPKCYQLGYCNEQDGCGLFAPRESPVNR